MRSIASRLFRALGISKKTRLPTSQEIEKLVSILPQLYAEGFNPIKRWDTGTKDLNGVFTIPRPEYDETVEAFFLTASSECWSDYNYHPEETCQMLENNSIVDIADLAQIKTMLTYCVRGEKFCEGHWGAMIESGHIRRLLQRLAQIGPEIA